MAKVKTRFIIHYKEIIPSSLYNSIDDLFRKTSKYNTTVDNISVCLFRGQKALHHVYSRALERGPWLGSERKWGIGQRVDGGRKENKKNRVTERGRECGSGWLESRIGCGWSVGQEPSKTALTGNSERK